MRNFFQSFFLYLIVLLGFIIMTQSKHMAIHSHFYDEEDDDFLPVLSTLDNGQLPIVAVCGMTVRAKTRGERPANSQGPRWKTVQITISVNTESVLQFSELGTGDILHQMKTEQNGDIHVITASGGLDSYFATGSTDGTVVFYKATAILVYQDGKDDKADPITRLEIEKTGKISAFPVEYSSIKKLDESIQNNQDADQAACLEENTEKGGNQQVKEHTKVQMKDQEKEDQQATEAEEIKQVQEETESEEKSQRRKTENQGMKQELDEKLKAQTKEKIPEEKEIDLSKEKEDVEMLQITDLAIYHKKRLVIYVASYHDGSIRITSRNGTIRNTVHSGNTTVIAIAMSPNQQFAFTTNEGIGSIRVMSRTGNFFNWCNYRHLTNRIRSLSFDLKANNLLYAASDDGKVFSFSSTSQSRSKADKKDDTQERLCSETEKINMELGSPISVAALQGYLLATSPDTLYVYNLTKMGRMTAVYAMERKFPSQFPNQFICSDESDNITEPAPLRLATCDAKKNQAYVIVAHPGHRHQCGQIICYRSNLPSEMQDFGGGLTRAPIFIIGLVGVFIYQMWKKKTGRRNFGRYGGGGGRRNRRFRGNTGNRSMGGMASRSRFR